MDPNQNLLSSDLQVDSIAATHLKETAMWAKFLGISGMVLSIIIAIIGLFAGTMLANMNRSFSGSPSTPAMTAMASVFVTIFYIFIGLVYFFLSLFLFRFATKMKYALLATDQDSFNNSLLNLKLVYRTLGIITVIYLSLIVLALIIGIAAAAFMS